MEAVVLVIQLFFDEHKQKRAEVETSSISECLEIAKQAFEIREYGGEKVLSVAAGCHYTINEKHA